MDALTVEHKENIHVDSADGSDVDSVLDEVSVGL